MTADQYRRMVAKQPGKKKKRRSAKNENRETFERVPRQSASGKMKLVWFVWPDKSESYVNPALREIIEHYEKLSA